MTAFPWSAEYPFLTFSYNQERIPPMTWALLGECASKIEHVMGTPLRQDIAERLHSVYLAKGVHGTTAIEGNTLTEEEVRERVEGGLRLPPTQEYLGREVDNIVRAYSALVRSLGQGVPFHFSPDDLKNLNRVVLDGLEVEPGVVPGEYRQGRVVVSDYRSPPREFVEAMLEQGCDWLNGQIWTAEQSGGLIVAILRAILSHLYIAWIHPFGDGNGRTARLVEFDLLIRAGVPIACAHLLSDYYNRTRVKYYRALSAARGDATHFVRYAVEGLRDMLREQIAAIRAQQLEVTWENYVYSTFRADEDSRTMKRRREIALVLGARRDVVPTEQIRVLTPKLGQLYASLTQRTLQRDLVALQREGLIVPQPPGYRANLALVTAFLPARGAAIAIATATQPSGDRPSRPERVKGKGE